MPSLRTTTPDPYPSNNIYSDNRQYPTSSRYPSSYIPRKTTPKLPYTTQQATLKIFPQPYQLNITTVSSTFNRPTPLNTSPLPTTSTTTRSWHTVSTEPEKAPIQPHNYRSTPPSNVDATAPWPNPPTETNRSLIQPTNYRPTPSSNVRASTPHRPSYKPYYNDRTTTVSSTSNTPKENSEETLDKPNFPDDHCQIGYRMDLYGTCVGKYRIKSQSLTGTKSYIVPKGSNPLGV